MAEVTDAEVQEVWERNRARGRFAIRNTRLVIDQMTEWLNGVWQDPDVVAEVTEWRDQLKESWDKFEGEAL